MQLKKIVLAALVGGLVVFVWESVAHVALPLGEMGLSALPNEAPVLESLHTSLPEPGLYFFPSPAGTSKEQQAAWVTKIQTGPSGLLVYRPQGGEAMSPRQLGSELLTDILAAALVAFVASLLAGPYARRVLAIALLGLFACVSILFSYWIWYGFPASFIAAETITQFVSWLLAGLVIAKLVPGPALARPDHPGRPEGLV